MNRELTKREEELLRDYYFDKDNEIDEVMSEEGYEAWKQDLSWMRLLEITDTSSQDDMDDDSE